MNFIDMPIGRTALSVAHCTGMLDTVASICPGNDMSFPHKSRGARAGWSRAVALFEA